MEKKAKIVFSPPRKRLKTFSTLDIKRKRPCFKSIEKVKKNNDNRCSEYYIEPDGPKIITYLEIKKKHTVEKKAKRCKEFTYFEDHKNCPETLLYTHDLLHPKLLRHHSKDKNKVKKVNKANLNKEMKNKVLSNSIRETNRFDVFMSLVKKEKITIK
jgi:hypothetical protein